MSGNVPVTILKNDKLPFPVLGPEGDGTDSDIGAYHSLMAQAMVPDYGAPSHEPDIAIVGYDIDKSRVMADAEDKFRTKAVENRNVSRAPQDLVDGLDRLAEMDDQLRHPKPLLKYLQFKKRSRLQEEAELLRSGLITETVVAYRARSEAIERTQREYQDDFHPILNDIDHALTDENSLARAQHYDFYASRIGDWAGALYDHPLSETFLEAYPDADISPQSLARLEYEEDQMNRKITSYERSRATVEGAVPEEELEIEILRRRLHDTRSLLDAVRHELGILAK